MSHLNPTALVLCGGKGTRMNSPSLHKVCFEIGGRPAIHRTLDALAEADVNRFVVVLGSMAAQVMECVASRYDGVSFAYQREPVGTGDAVRTGLSVITNLGADAPVMVTMGDKIVKADLTRRILERFGSSDADAVCAVQPIERYPRGGRVVLNNDGSAVAIVEAKDADHAVQTGQPVSTAGGTISVEQIKDVRYANAAVYLFKQSVLTDMVAKLTTDNVQGEYYLTDVISMVAVAGGRVETVLVDAPDEVLSFNTVDELLDVERVLIGAPPEAAEFSQSKWKPVATWSTLFETSSEPIAAGLEDVYGSDQKLMDERRRAYQRVLDLFARHYGESRDVVISRAPGRANLMGRHVEHRGGWVNVIAINKEVVCVAAPRDDDLVRIVNTDPTFPEQEFRISDHFKRMDWQSWTQYLDAGETQALVLNAKGNWVNYVKAAVLRLQYAVKDRPLKGMDMAFTGNIPMAAGLSSSSAVVVATAEAAIEANGLDIEPQEFVDLCGEGEWYVGSRGGSGDHAAMKFGNRGSIAHLAFLPFRFERLIPFPDGHRLVIANSFIRAEKTTNAKDIFNERIASYEFALAWLLEENPELKSKVTYLRDVNPATLAMPPSRVYELLLNVPEYAALDEIRAALPGDRAEWIDRIASSHTVPDRYPLRSVFLYGIAECMRSRRAAGLLESGDVQSFGNMMVESHDGDRVVSHNGGEQTAHDSSAPDELLRTLIADLRSEDPERVSRAQLERQGGGYACSTPETDFLVDTAMSVAGVIGAQLSGAGLGGCVMILVRDDAVEALTSKLLQDYYEPRGFDSGITVCIPVSGSMVWEVG